MISPMVRYDNRDLYDGGILDPIPIDKSIADQNQFHVIILTQKADYQKSRSQLGPLLWVHFRKYPHLIWAMQERHNVYNRQIALAEQLEREGRALIIRPHADAATVSRFETDPRKLLPLYDRGQADGAEAVEKLRKLFSF